MINNENSSNKVLTAFVFCFYLFALGSFGIRARWVFIFMLFLTSFLALLYTKTGTITINNYKKKLYIVYFVIALFIFFPNARRHSDIYNFLMYITIIVYVGTIIRTDSKEISDIKKIMIYMGLFFAFYISFFRFFPGLYRVTIYKFLASSVKDTYNLNSGFGYGFPIGNSYTFADSAILLGMVSLISTDLVEEEKDIRYKLYLMIMFAGMVLEGRKSELLAAFLTVVYLYSFELKGNKRILRQRLKYVICIILFTIIALKVFENNDLLHRFNVLIDRLKQNHSGNKVDYTSGRFALWGNAIKLFMKYPIIGAGWGRFANYTKGYYQEVETSIHDTHNVFLQLLCEIGIIGTLFIVSPILVILHRVWKKARYFKKGLYKNNCAGNSYFCLGILLYSILLSFMDPNFYSPFFWSMFIICIVIQDHEERDGWGINLK